MKYFIAAALFLSFSSIASAQTLYYGYTGQTYTTSGNFSKPTVVTGVTSPSATYQVDPQSLQPTLANSPTVTGLARDPNTGNLTYFPLEPFNASQASFGYGQGGFQAYAASVYPLTITIFFLIALIIGGYSGITLMFGEASEKLHTQAKKRLNAVMVAIGLVLLSFVIFYTINPDILVFKINLTPSPTTNYGTTNNTFTPTNNNTSQNLITTNPLTSDQYTRLNSALNPLMSRIAGIQTDVVGALPMPNSNPDQNLIDQFSDQCNKFGVSKTGILTGTAVATYFTRSPIVAVTGIIAAGSQPIFSVQKETGDSVGLPDETIYTCVTTRTNG